jgi:putative oxidoreductase
MFVVIATVHWSNGFFNARGGYEFNLLIAATAIALAITGPGEFSIDHLAGWTLAGPAWGLGALGISAAAAGSVLALRKPRPEQEQEEKSRDEVPAT